MPSRIRSVYQIVERRDRLYRAWEELRLRYAPHREGIWSSSSKSRLVGQGWKLHLSATTLTAVDLLERCGDALAKCGRPFKIIAELSELERLNSGTVHGRSQIGKAITVYCPQPDEARLLAERLHLLTEGIACPEVPSDRRYRNSGCVFYRYGGYEMLKLEQDAECVPAYRDATGKLVPDRRTAATAVPEGMADPFVAALSVRQPKRCALPRYKAMSAIQWRGAGGVYHVLDTSTHPPQGCIMKTGIRHGGVGIDGSDGVMHRTKEHQVLQTLGKAGVAVPRVIEFFKQSANAHLVLQLIPGKNLWQIASAGEIGLDQTRRLAVQLVDIVASIHALGWVWRDCKLSNLVDDGRRLWAVDFESACRIGDRAKLLCYTPGYILEKPEIQTAKAALKQDLYALGITLHRIFASEAERPDMPALPAKALPQGLPVPVKECIGRLCARDPATRPGAAEVKALLAGELASGNAIRELRRDAGTTDSKLAEQSA
jgi:class IV lanthipeptide synthase